MLILFKIYQKCSGMKYIPNILSVFRFFSAFAFAHFVLKNQFLSAFLLLILAALSDFFDGYVARRFNAVTSLGAKIDPVADKAFIIISYICFAKMGLITGGVALVVVLRDLIIVGVVLACMLKTINLDFSPLFSSKVNTCIQLIFLIIVLVCKLTNQKLDYIIDIASVIVVLSTLYSALAYIRTYRWLKNEFFNKKI